jgi:3-hydroxybutyrate dehydrogenase
MRCKTPDAPQCKHCKRRATLQRARYNQQKCAPYSCAVPYHSIIMTTTDLSGKTALITGSTGGLGLAIATGLARTGCKVMLHGIEAPDAVAASPTNLEAEHHVAVRYHQADLARPGAIDELVNACETQLGGVDVLINNAVVRHFAPTEAFPPDRWDQAIAVNLTAPFHAIRLTLPGMQARGWGRIFNMSSVYGSRGTTNRIDYVTTKSGILGMTRAVALENVANGITCNAVCPGSVLTPDIARRVQNLMQDRELAYDDAVKLFLKGKQPTGRFISADHVAELILFLCSDAAADITGAMMPLEGGWLAG